MLLPRTCPMCGCVGSAPCASCAALLEPAPSYAPPPGVDELRAPLAYTGVGRELVARLKYRNARSVVAWLAARMAALVDQRTVDVVTWVPTSVERRRARGFDQSELLARAVAARLHRPCRALLRRGTGPAQTGLPAAARRRGPPLIAQVGGRVPQRVLVVDDVVTTGTTATVAAGALRSSGVRSVVFVTAARTPLKRPLTRSEVSS